MSKLLIEIESRVSKSEQDLIRFTKRLDAIEKAGDDVDKSMAKNAMSVDKFGNAISRADANVGRYIDSTGRMREANGRFARSSGDASFAIGKFGTSSSMASNAITGLGYAATAAVAGIVAVTNALSNSVVQSDNNARSAGLTALEYQQLGFAAERYGLNVQQLSDAYQDARRNVADFITTGGGPLQDFADAMGYSAKETRALAVSISGLSGQEIIQRLTDEMLENGVSIEQAGQALDSIGSDLDKVLPLLVNNGQEAKRLAYELSLVASPISQDDLKTYREFDEQTALLVESFKSLATNAMAPIADWLGDIYEKAAKVFAIFNDETVLGNERAIRNTKAEIESLKTSIQTYQDLIADPAWYKMDFSIKIDQGLLEKQQQKLKEAQQRLLELEERHKKLSGLDLPNGNNDEDSERKPTDVVSTGQSAAEKAAAAELAATNKLWMTQQQLVQETYRLRVSELDKAIKAEKIGNEQYAQGIEIAGKERSESLKRIYEQENAELIAANKKKEAEQKRQQENEDRDAKRKRERLKKEQEKIIEDLNRSIGSQSQILEKKYEDEYKKLGLAVDIQKKLTVQYEIDYTELKGNPKAQEALKARYEKEYQELKRSIEAQKTLTAKYEIEKAYIEVEKSKSDLGFVDAQISSEESQYEDQTEDQAFFTPLFNDDANEAYLEKMRELVAQRNQILSESRTAELEAITLDYEIQMELASTDEEARLEALNEFNQKRIAIETEYKDAISENSRKISDIEKNSVKQRTAALDQFASIIGSVNSQIFKDNKTLKKAEVVVSGISAGMKSYEWGAGIGGPILGAAMAATSAAFSLAQLNAIDAANEGGGTVSASTGASASVPTAPVTQQQPQDQVMNIQASDASGANQFITVKFDESTDLGEFLNKALSSAQMDGRI